MLKYFFLGGGVDFFLIPAIQIFHPCFSVATATGVRRQSNIKSERQFKKIKVF